MKYNAQIISRHFTFLHDRRDPKIGQEERRTGQSRLLFLIIANRWRVGWGGERKEHTNARSFSANFSFNFFFRIGAGAAAAVDVDGFGFSESDASQSSYFYQLKLKSTGRGTYLFFLFRILICPFPSCWCTGYRSCYDRCGGATFFRLFREVYRMLVEVRKMG